jgi:hypothetical protein
LRKRVTLEDANLLPRIGVDVHPDRNLAKEPHKFFPGFSASEWLMNRPPISRYRNTFQSCNHSFKHRNFFRVFSNHFDHFLIIFFLDCAAFGGRVKFLPLAWAGMPKTSFRKNSDSPHPDQAVGLYAGAGRSRLYQKGDSVNIERETLKKMVAEHQLEIMVATDAACEGLNLQTLGTLINVDLPWNSLQPTVISSVKSLRDKTSEQSRQSFSEGSMVVV